MAYTGAPNQFVLNLYELQNVVTNAAGNDPTTLATTVAEIADMVNTTSRTVFTNNLSNFTSGSNIQILANMALSGGVDITQGGNSVINSTSNAGLATLVAGTVSVANAGISASPTIMLTPQSSGSIGTLSYTSVAGVGFTINSTDGGDTRTIAYLIVIP